MPQQPCELAMHTLAPALTLYTEVVRTIEHMCHGSVISSLHDMPHDSVRPKSSNRANPEATRWKSTVAELSVTSHAPLVGNSFEVAGAQAALTDRLSESSALILRDCVFIRACLVDGCSTSPSIWMEFELMQCRLKTKC